MSTEEDDKGSEGNTQGHPEQRGQKENEGQDQEGQEQEGDAQEDQLPKGIKEFIQHIPEENRQEAIQAIQEVAVKTESHFQGPLPPPEHLQAYDQIVENGAERIFTSFEEEGRHRRHIITRLQNESNKGQTLAFVVGLAAILVTPVLAYLGAYVAASILASTLIGLVWAFIAGRKGQNRNEDGDQQQ